MVPQAEAAARIRSGLRELKSATAPRSSSPTRFSAGTRTRSKKSRNWLCASMPRIGSFRFSRPGASVGTRKSENPWAFGWPVAATSRYGVVRVTSSM